MRRTLFPIFILFITACSGKGLPRDLSGNSPDPSAIRADRLTTSPFYKKTACLFDDSKVNIIRVSIPQKIMAEVVLRPYYPRQRGKKVYGLCRFISINGETFTNTGIRSRGNTSIRNYKRQFKIALDCTTAYRAASSAGKTNITGNRGNNFHGIRKFNLRASQNDPSLLREKLATWIFEQAGAPASRTGFARLYINNTYWGLYIVTEQINGDFIKARFGSKKGPLYKAIGARAHFNSGSLNGFEVKNAPSSEGIRLLKNRFARLESIRSVQDLATIFHLKNALNYLAAGIICGHWDSFLGIDNNDYLYLHKDGRLRIIAWDLDNTFGSGLGWGFPVKNAGLFFLRRSSNGSRLFTSLFNDSKWKRYYLAKMRCLLNRLFHSGAVYRMIDRWKKTIRSAVYEDPRKAVDWRFFNRQKSNRAWELATENGPLLWVRSGFGGYRGGLKTWLRERAAHLENILKML